MTKGQVEARISEAISQFEIQHMGRGPERIRTYILNDMIIIRLNGFLHLAERKLSQEKEGVELVKKMRTALFESSREELEHTIKKVIDVRIISTHSDVSTKTGEKIIILVLDQDLESQWKTK
jgi:uncharacterized protein YbcI